MMREEELYVRRGNLLWEGSRMMLPEHKEALIKLEASEWKVELHGELDDEQWWEIGEIVLDAFKHTTTVKVNYWDDGFYKDLECYIHKVDNDNKRIRVEYGPANDSLREWIPMRVIYDVQRT
ncbi:hypothetical protein JOC54_001075 [Alkalihalobacillus xiaoxiensis]|uniref:Uncharacterized protein n=1 Tax=Shouchella xiaoxiensis TaxID=766895 RepID=A0ABS2SQP4_9BACI|nr:YolD-like family protein [Shouchella xiaoxiensis]MBM7837844.1 hypothetical protein [Shouchella xiaoxiensis]